MCVLIYGEVVLVRYKIFCVSGNHSGNMEEMGRDIGQSMINNSEKV